MAEIRVVDASWKTARDLAWLCVPPDKANDPALLKGVEAKEKWAREMLKKGMPFAKLAYVGSEVAGLIHYEPQPDEGTVLIHCIFVPQERHWNRGVGTQLLNALLEEMGQPQPWNGDKPASALITWTFPGELPDQLSAREFFLKKGFQAVSDDPDLLFLPFHLGFRFQPKKRELSYRPNPEDEGKAVIIHGPSFCPWSCFFNLQAERVIREVAPEVPVRWIDRSTDPSEAEKREGFEGIVVNGKPIQSFVLDKENFVKEVQEALGIS